MFNFEVLQKKRYVVEQVKMFTALMGFIIFNRYCCVCVVSIVSKGTRIINVLWKRLIVN